jgi:ABC-type branched-subunit amino acid transport system substrate-binding protein
MTGIDDRSGQNSGRSPGDDEDRDSPAEQLEQILRGLIKDSGKPYSQLAPEVPCGRSTIADAVSGDPQRVPGSKIIEGICRACGADNFTITEVLALREAIKPKEQAAADPPIDMQKKALPDRGRPVDPVPDARPWYRRLGWQAAAVAALIGLIVAGRFLIEAVGFLSDKSCQGPGVIQSGQHNECVGVTDGAATFDFAPALGLQTVLSRIKQENDAVVGSGAPFVSIGYVVPLPRNDTTGWLTSLRHELQGAYLAQWRANHSDGLGDIPLIRLLVINVGEQAGQQGKVIAEVLKRVADPAERLIAVAGLSESLDATKQAIRSLSNAGIPMIASRLTADDLSTIPGQPVRGLFRIASTTSTQTAAAAEMLKSMATLLVQDENPSDFYTHSLAEQFRTVFTTPPAGKLLESERYDSSLPSVENTFGLMMANICIKQPAAIYYAGRGANLPAFLAALAGRPCQQLKINLFTASNAVNLTANLRQQLAAGNQDGIAANLRANIVLHYTGLAHPGTWSDQQRFLPIATRIFQHDCANCFTRVFPQEQLDDGSAIISYDALLVTIRAIRSGVSQLSNASFDPTTLTPGAVLQQMFRINQAAPVNGASGPIAFDERGKPINKPIPILQLNPDSTVTLIRSV